jgi:NADH-quinone oxidoreductase subunit L
MAFLYASLSLIGFPLTSGFYSKETIIDAVGYYGHTMPYIMLLLSIFTTTLYTAKIFSKVFFGECTLHIEDEKENVENKENDREMLMPLAILTIPSVFLGIFIYDSLMLGTLFGSSLASQELVISFYNNYVINSLNFFLHSFITINFLILLSAIIFSYYYYYKKSFEIKIPIFIKNILIEEYGFNNFSSKYIPKFQNFVAKYLWKKIDISTIDNGLINNTSYFFDKISYKIRKLHTGYIYHYSLTIITALILLLLIIRFRY